MKLRERLPRLNWKFYGALSIVVVTWSVFKLATQTRSPLAKNFAFAQRVANAAVPPGQAPPDGSRVVGNGVIEPLQPELRVAASAAGRIGTVHVKEGDRVEAGTLLLELENSTQRASLASALSDVDVAQAELTRTAHGLPTQEVDAVVSDATAARARRDLATQELARVQHLVEAGSVPQAELDRARQVAGAEGAAAHAAEARARAARGGARFEDILVAEAQLRAAKTRADLAKANLEQTMVYAPISGEILRVKFHTGEYYTPSVSVPLLLMGDTSSLRARIDVNERDVARLKEAAKAYVTVGAHGDAKFPGVVVEIGKRMGRKNLRSDDPGDRIDVEILEAVVQLDGHPPLIPGLRVVGYIDPAAN